MILVRCPDCGLNKPSEAFPRNKNRPNGLGLYCKSCFAVRYRVHREKKAAQQGKTVTARRQVLEDHAFCPRCETIKPIADFPRNRSARSGRGAYCKPCHNAKGRETYERLYGSTRNYHLRRRYGITAAQYDELLAAQGGRCAACRERPAEHVDHDHLFGHVRGLLCSCCNQGLGNFRDDLAHLRAAVDYLERTTWHRRETTPGVYQLTSPRPAAAASPSSSALPHLISSRRG